MTAQRVAQLAVTAGLPERLGSAIWVDLQSGKPDEGMTVNIFTKDKFSLDGLIGHATYGAALGYEVVKRGNMVVSVLAGAAHPWNGKLQSGWHPVAGFGVKF